MFKGRVFQGNGASRGVRALFMPPPPSTPTERPPIVAAGQEGLERQAVFPDEKEEGIKEHGAEGDARAEGRAERAEAGDEPIAAEGQRRQPDARADGAVAYLPAADEVMAQDRVAPQGHDADREPPDDHPDAHELAAEKDFRKDPLRDEGDEADRQRQGQGGELQQAEGDLGLPAGARFLGHFLVLDEGDAPADVPDALGDACPRVEQPHAPQSPEPLDQEIVEAGGENLRQVVGPRPQPVAEHLAQQPGQPDGGTRFPLMDNQRDEAVETVEASDTVGDAQPPKVGLHGRPPSHEIEIDEDEKERPAL